MRLGRGWRPCVATSSVSSLESTWSPATPRLRGDGIRARERSDHAAVSGLQGSDGCRAAMAAEQWQQEARVGSLWGAPEYRVAPVEEFCVAQKHREGGGASVRLVEFAH